MEVILISDIISVLSSPVSTVIIGSVVGAGVGFFLNYQTTRLTRKADQKKAIQEHIREFSTLALQVEASVKYENDLLWSLYELPDSERERKVHERPECPIDELIMLTILYLPELKKDAIELRESIDKIRGSYDDFIEGNDSDEHYQISEGPTFLNQSYAAILRKVFARFDTSYLNILASLEKLSVKYR